MSSHQFDVRQRPCPVEHTLFGGVEAEHRVEAFAGNRLGPVALLAGGGFGPEVKVNRAVRVGLEFVVGRVGGVTARVLKHGAGRGVIERQRPEGRGRYVRRHVQAVRLAAVEAIAVLVLERLDVLRPGAGFLRANEGRRVDRAVGVVQPFVELAVVF